MGEHCVSRSEKAKQNSDSSDGKIPENAIPIGKDADNRVLYAGRCQVRQNRYRFVPGYVSKEEPRVITAYGTRARTGNRNEVLISDKIGSSARMDSTWLFLYV